MIRDKTFALGADTAANQTLWASTFPHANVTVLQELDTCSRDIHSTPARGGFDVVVLSDVRCVLQNCRAVVSLLRSSGFLVIENSTLAHLGEHDECDFGAVTQFGSSVLIRRNFESLPLFERDFSNVRHDWPRIAHVSYSTVSQKYATCAGKAFAWASKWATMSNSLSPFDLSCKFRRDAAAILEHARGAGYWVWKPFVILNQIRIIDADYLVYSDACSITSYDIRQLALQMAPNSFLAAFRLTHVEKVWSKQDVVEALGCDTECANSFQFGATVSVWKVGDPRSMQFLSWWTEAIMDPHNVTDSPSKRPNDLTFREHRHDQSLFSILVKRSLKQDANSVIVNPWKDADHHVFG